METISQIQSIQSEELRILIEFQRICNVLNLRYFAIGGTCLGAIRHKGFIPWDDDIDVAMPYRDYCILREKAKDLLVKPYELVDQRNNKHNSNLYIKIHDTETTFIEDSVVDFKDRYTGVFIDIMPVYGLPDNETALQHVLKKYFSLSRKNVVLRLPYSKMETTARRILWILMTPHRIILPYHYYSDKIEQLLSKNDFGNSNKIIFGWRGKKKKIVFDYSFFRNVKEVPFEQTQILIPYDYDGYLKADFGDYMTLPPLEKRVTVHPTAIIDLYNSYKKYY